MMLAVQTELPSRTPVSASVLNHWVALDDRSVIVDADAELDELCTRINSTRKTALTIFFVAKA